MMNSILHLWILDILSVVPVAMSGSDLSWHIFSYWVNTDTYMCEVESHTKRHLGHMNMCAHSSLQSLKTTKMLKLTGSIKHPNIDRHIFVFANIHELLTGDY